MTASGDRAERFFDAYNNKQFDLIETMIEPVLDFAHFNRGFTVTDRGELVEGLRQFAAHGAPDRRFIFERSTAQGNICVREHWWQGTALVDLPGLVTAGQPFRLRLCSVLRFNEAGKVVEWKDHG